MINNLVAFTKSYVFTSDAVETFALGMLRPDNTTFLCTSGVINNVFVLSKEKAFNIVKAKFARIVAPLLLCVGNFTSLGLDFSRNQSQRFDAIGCGSLGKFSLRY